MKILIEDFSFFQPHVGFLITISVYSQLFRGMENTHFSQLFDKLDEDRKDDQVYCDVTISVNNKLFPAHRCILATFCVYFATLFRSSFNDKFDDTIKISGAIGDDMKASTFQTVLNFCYKNQSGLTKDNIYDVLSAAEFLQNDKLKERYLMHRIPDLNAKSVAVHDLGIHSCM